MGEFRIFSACAYLSPRLFSRLKIFSDPPFSESDIFELRILKSFMTTRPTSFRIDFYNDLVCDYKLSLAHMLNDLFHTLC
jgi:hypothetical protein